ncbi:hypothetical protein V0288_11185 [Pannus brasiliensis CCIBt3594]|uniref:Uncharacterized protein n=1 Tax=Pannus brasiliensis CCIBt3594 TaxID=1427578 RepID=A0AAW9QKR0_9CHRO
MLDQANFLAYLGDFLDAYDKQSDKILGNSLAFAAWYEYLSANLSESELKPALQCALVHFEFLPSPKQVVEAFKGSREVLAWEEWQKCVNASKSRNTDDILLSLQGDKALASIGGFPRLASEDPNKLHSFVSKEFVSRWVMYERAIAAKVVEPPAPKLKAAIEEPKTEEWKPWTSEALAQFRENGKKMFGDKWVDRVLENTGE